MEPEEGWMIELWQSLQPTTSGDDTYTSASILRSFKSCRGRAEIASGKRESVCVAQNKRERER